MASHSSTNPNVMDILFNNSIMTMLFSFLGIYFVCYLVFGVMLKSENSASLIHRALDLIIFGILILYALIVFYNSYQNNPNTLWQNLTTNTENLLNDSYTIVHAAIFIILFHVLLFLFRIPISGEMAPYFVPLFLGGAWIVLIASLIVWFFNNFLNVSLFDSNLWNDLTSSQPSIKVDVNINGNTKLNNTYDVHAPQDEVFNISNNLYTYDDAKAVCTAYGARLATYDEVEDAYNKGGEWCNYGWSSDQMALFPTQKLTWYSLQRNPKHKNDCGRPGVNGGYMENPYIRFGVNCFGKKPAATDKDKQEMNANKEIIVPKTAEEIELDKKVQFWKENADKLLNVNSFNRNKWSEY
jgi:Extracellular link domain